MGITSCDGAIFRDGPDGKLEPFGYHKFYREVGGKTYLNLDEKTGVLKISMSPNQVEFYLSKYLGEIPKEGIRIKLPLPSGEYAYLEGVKSIESTLEPDRKYLMKLDEKYILCFSRDEIASVFE